MLDDFERAMCNRKINKRVRMLAETGRDCDIEVDFTTKNEFLEERIEFTQKYFTYINDLNHKNA